MLTISATTNILSNLAGLNWSAFATAFQDRGTNLPADADATETVLAALSDVGFVIPYGALIEEAVPVAAELIELILVEGSQDKPGAQLPPFAGGDDSDPARGR